MILITSEITEVYIPKGHLKCLFRQNGTECNRRNGFSIPFPKFWKCWDPHPKILGLPSPQLGPLLLKFWESVAPGPKRVSRPLSGRSYM
uniref:Uncharacterized protein n=1 Tax=Romanomermis culicivorax TaxID=13658 RepID=A0A915HR01_ROMCU